MERLFHNPILPGFYPDPSICRKGDDFYLVTSTFEYFPGVPVFHSRDLVHWRQIGHCLNRPSQIDLGGLDCSKGIYAATIRYHRAQDLFYMITTRVGADYRDNVNFYVTAADPAGPWSEPVVIPGAEGIDPTLFFDDDGTAYYLGNLRPDPGAPANGRRHIWLQAIDLQTGTLLGERHILRTDGALYGAKCPEGPHLYHIRGWYYLLIAEGGTAQNHCVTVFRSRSLFGPYAPNPRNPLITHRHLRRPQPVSCVGHADLIETPGGEWWAVLLGMRQVGHTERGNLGRETFLVPVIWEDEWPVFCPDSGHVESAFPAPALPAHCWPEADPRDHFQSQALALHWMTLRAPGTGRFSLTQRPGWLRLYLHPETLDGTGSPAFLCRRQQHMHFSACTCMEFKPLHAHESAGIAVLISRKAYLSMEYTLVRGAPALLLRRCAAGSSEILAQMPCSAGKLLLKITAHEQWYSFSFSDTPGHWRTLLEHVDGSFMSVEQTQSYTGTVVGLYASSNGHASKAHADFDWFDYREIPC